jgi:hypothetical protein
MLPNLSL